MFWVIYVLFVFLLRLGCGAVNLAAVPVTGPLTRVAIRVADPAVGINGLAIIIALMDNDQVVAVLERPLDHLHILLLGLLRDSTEMLLLVNLR